MIRRAGPQDHARIDAFLAARAESSMFLRSNMVLGAPLWVQEEEAIEGVFGLSPGEGAQYGSVQMPQNADWPALRRALAGRVLRGLNGPGEQVAAARVGLGLQGAPVELDLLQPLFTLALSDLAVPEGNGTLRPATRADFACIACWRTLYLTEALSAPSGDETRAMAESEAEAMIARGHLRLLAEGEELLAMTDFNAVLPDVVQVGGVFAPRALRGRGYARRAVALHLAEAQARGVGRAILFAVSAAAARAYIAIGFRQVGTYHVLNFATPVEITAE